MLSRQKIYIGYYLKKYGRKCDESEWEEYSNMFTSELYLIDEYYISIINGQGSFIQIKKIE